MDFLEYIKQLNDKELYEEITDLINRMEKDSKRINNTDYFGFNISSDLENHRVSDSTLNLNIKCIYDGYIPRDTKIIYGFAIDKFGLVSNKGMYYNLDDDNYIYEFCKYIRNIDIINEEDFFEYVLIFLKDYFGTFMFNERDDMFKLIFKDEKTYHNPVKEHKFTTFKGKGNALCTEYSIMANNILNTFGIYSCILMGLLEITGSGKEGHAFNIVSYKSSNTGDTVNCLVDFSNSVDVYDFNYKKIGDSPYILHIDNIEDTVNKFICNGIHIMGDEYSYMVLGRSLLSMHTEKKRDYSPCNDLTLNFNPKVKQK